ncbi:MAG: TldE/PmbA family protein [Methylophilaceae bacterium]|nr:TldE/PmbA family protein [Methylophilaceae bacterium]
MKTYFYALADALQHQLKNDEQFTCWLAAEDSDFVRFNRGAIRQPGHVHQIYLSLKLINGLRHANSSTTLSGHLQTDHTALDKILADLRSQLPDLPEDPHLLISTGVNSTEHIVASRLPATDVIVNDILALANAYDFVGILAAGALYRGFANSYGQRNWHETSNFNLDWSLYQTRDKAVKTAYAGFDWDSTAFREKFHAATAQLENLKREPVTIKPGAYRAYLTPTALGEIISMLNWDGFSEKSLRTKQSSLRRMRDEGLELSAKLNLSENTAQGLAPGFQSEGFIKPERITLLDHGRLVNSMIAPRTAKEYDLTTNGSETLASLDIAAGELPLSQILAELGTGIYISNLWYLNFSDRANCRVTGMTRFATFWVENGVIKAPLNVMRFDDSLFRILGENLLALTNERELLIDNDSYGERSTHSARLPGALVKDFTFVL